MTKLSDLQPFKEPPPVEKESCHACRAFAPEVLVPIGEDAVPMCWLCAHHVWEHACPIDQTCDAECECTAHEIFPHRAFQRPGDLIAFGPDPTPAQRRLSRFEHGDSGAYADRKNPHPDDWKTGHLFNPETGCIDTILRGEIVDSVPVAPVAVHGSGRQSSKRPKA